MTVPTSAPTTSSAVRAILRTCGFSMRTLGVELGNWVDIKGVGMVIQEHPKTSDSNRTVPLADFAADTLRHRRAHARHTDLVFPSHRGKVRDPSDFRKGWDAFQTRAGYEWVHPHVFRKTAATLMDDPTLAGALLGHAPGSHVTERNYIARAAVAPDVRDRLNAMGNRPANTQRKEGANAMMSDDEKGRELPDRFLSADESARAPTTA